MLHSLTGLGPVLRTKLWRNLTYILILLSPEGRVKDGEEKLSSGGCLINLPFLPSCLEGLEGHFEQGNASGACSPLSTLRSRLQKTLSLHSPATHPHPGMKKSLIHPPAP